MIKHPDFFVDRHLGPTAHEQEKMLKSLGLNSLDELVNQTIPGKIRLEKELSHKEALSEYDYLQMLKGKAAKNKIFRSFIGQGYYDCITPSVILRNIFENPGWYTQYTPYQAEIAQGRLEALLNFQTMVSDFTGLPVANASEVGVSVSFSDEEIQIISAWYSDRRSTIDRKSRKGQRNGIPPGIAKNLERGKPLPPGVAKQHLPEELRNSLPAPPDGYERIVVSGKVLLVDIATQVIHDVLTDVILD